MIRGRFPGIWWSRGLPVLGIAFLTLVFSLDGVLADVNGAAADEPKKLALLVGVSEYRHKSMDDLQYPENDVSELGRQLDSMGFEVTTVTGKNASYDNLMESLESFLEATEELGKNDIVMILFSGHGQQLSVTDTSSGNSINREIPFFCAYDAVSIDNAGDEDFSSMDEKKVGESLNQVSLNWVIRQVDRQSGSLNNLMVVDACRNNPAKGKSVDGSTARRLPRGMSILFGAKSGQKSWESTNEKIPHGVLSYVLLQGLKGAAKNKRSQITWLGLVTYVSEEVPEIGPGLAGANDRVQNPHFVNNSDVNTVLGKGLLPEFKSVVTGGAMRLIPAGSFNMGSGESIKEIMDVFPYESAEQHQTSFPQHPVTITKPFYIGKHEVTIGEFKKFVGETNYKTDSENNKAKPNPMPIGVDPRTVNWRKSGHENVSDRHPVTVVSWNDAQEYCKWLSQKEKRKVRLPTQAEWEYACRAGSDTRFFFGNDAERLATFANVPNRQQDGVRYLLFFGAQNQQGQVDEFVIVAPRTTKEISFVDDQQGGFQYKFEQELTNQEKILVKNLSSFQISVKTGQTEQVIGPRRQFQLGDITTTSPIDLCFDILNESSDSNQKTWQRQSAMQGSRLYFSRASNRWQTGGMLMSRDLLNTDQLAMFNGDQVQTLKIRVGEQVIDIAPQQEKMVRGKSVKLSNWINADDGHAGLAPVGQFLPNQFGIFDMHGNVWEWCQDGFDLDYSKKVSKDPKGSARTDMYAIRGACYL